MCKNRGILAKNGGTTRAKNVPPSSVADPDHLDTDPDPGWEKLVTDPDPGKNATDPDPAKKDQVRGKSCDKKNAHIPCFVKLSNEHFSVNNHLNRG